MTTVSNEVRPALTPAAQAFLSRPKRLFVDGGWVDPVDGATYPVIDPATGLEVDRIAAAGPADVDRAARAAARHSAAAPGGGSRRPTRPGACSRWPT